MWPDPDRTFGAKGCWFTSETCNLTLTGQSKLDSDQFLTRSSRNVSPRAQPQSSARTRSFPRLGVSPDSETPLSGCPPGPASYRQSRFGTARAPGSPCLPVSHGCPNGRGGAVPDPRRAHTGGAPAARPSAGGLAGEGGAGPGVVGPRVGGRGGRRLRAHGREPRRTLTPLQPRWVIPANPQRTGSTLRLDSRGQPSRAAVLPVRPQSGAAALP